VPVQSRREKYDIFGAECACTKPERKICINPVNKKGQMGLYRAGEGNIPPADKKRLKRQNWR